MSAQSFRTRPPRPRRGAGVVIALLVLAVAAGVVLLGPNLLGRSPWDSAPAPEPTPSPLQPLPTTDPPDGDRPHPTTAQQALAVITVKEHTATPGYDRQLFDFNGFDFDRNGCDARNDMLRRDLGDPVIKPGSDGCRVESGVLHDRYSGQSLPVMRDQVDIDHVVPLANAWVSGAASWATESVRNSRTIRSISSRPSPASIARRASTTPQAGCRPTARRSVPMSLVNSP